MANGIQVKCLNLYQKFGNQIDYKINGMTTNFFKCNMEVRQGENLSPFLSSLCIYNPDMYLQEKGIVGLQSSLWQLKKNQWFT